MDKLADRIATLEERLRELKGHQQRSVARQRTLASRRDRRDDTRRKILVGALILTQVERGEVSRDSLRAALGRYLIRSDDRALFDLPPANGSSSTASSNGTLGSTQGERSGR